MTLVPPGVRETVLLGPPAGRSVPVLFAEMHGNLYVIPTGGRGGWIAQVLRVGYAEVTTSDGRTSRWAARLSLDPSEMEAARVALRRKYGEPTWSRYFAGHSKVLVLAPVPPRAARSPLEWIQEEFDASAAEYDRRLQTMPIERYLKARTLDTFLERFRDCDPLLEIGAGTGAETLPLLSAGHTITAVDISERMLAELTRGAREGGWLGRLSVCKGQLGNLSEALAGTPAGSFGGAYSSFGAFNLETEFGRVPGSLAQLVRPRGWLAFTTLNRPGLAPLAWEVLAGNPLGGLSRFGRRIPPERIRYPLEIQTRPPGAMRDAFAPWFRPVSMSPVSVLAPPFESPRMLSWLSARGVMRLQHLDQRLTRLPGGAALGEWVLLTFQRTDAPAPPVPL
ncbi:MAG: class I SAM-dependent methyltransferase [Thermoplasmata archaeon]|nr:class I SAM-dependent methyltransferase [Thermoplasmata archaeon]